MLASGYFAWATLCTLIFGGGSILPLVHHFLCFVVYLITLRPFLHHTGNVFLLWHASTLVLDAHSVGKILGAPSSGANRTLRLLHPAVFFVVRIAIGLPLSARFMIDMARLLWMGNAHSNAQVWFMIAVNVFINILNLAWLLDRRFSACNVAPGGGVNFFEATLKYKTSTSFNNLKNLGDERRARKPKAPKFLQASRALLLLLVVVGGFFIVMGSNFTVDAPDVNKYSDVLFGDEYREKSAIAAGRAKNLVEELNGEFKNLTRTIEKNWNVSSPVFDVVISGGGFRGQYAGGVLSVLTLLEKQGVLRIERWAGTSIGACTAASFAMGVDYEDFFRVPYAWQGVWQKREFWKGGPVVREMMKHTLKGDQVHVELTEKLSVSITVFDGLWPRNVLVNKFKSKEELIEALVAGASIPLFTGHPFFGKWKGKVALDGGITLNTPTFKDARNAQLVINLGYVKYPIAHTFGPLDPNHEVRMTNDYEKKNDCLISSHLITSHHITSHHMFPNHSTPMSTIRFTRRRDWHTRDKTTLLD